MATTCKSGRCFRRAVVPSDDSDEDETDNTDITENERLNLSDIKELQKLRERQRGISAEALAEVKAERRIHELSTNDPLKMKTGGMVDMKNLKKQKLSDEDREAIGTAFAAETNRRDEDTEMLKYVEEELAHRKGHLKVEGPSLPKKQKFDNLYVVPEHLATQSRHKQKEGMISSTMLSGIPEVDLGIETKITNIEKTEQAKHDLMMKRLRKKDDEGSEFIPTNMAVNFMQHNRFNVEDSLPVTKKIEPAPKIEPLRVGDAEKLENVQGKSYEQREKATDDEHYNRFRSKMKY